MESQIRYFCPDWAGLFDCCGARDGKIPVLLPISAIPPFDKLRAGGFQRMAGAAGWV